MEASLSSCEGVNMGAFLISSRMILLTWVYGSTVFLHLEIIFAIVKQITRVGLAGGDVVVDSLAMI